MEHIIKKINMIDILGMLLPGGLMLLLLEQDLHWMKDLLDYLGAKADNLLFIMIFLCGSYGVGMLLHEMGSIIEKLMWKVPLFSPEVWAAVETKLAGRYNKDGTLRALEDVPDSNLSAWSLLKELKNAVPKSCSDWGKILAALLKVTPALLTGVVVLGVIPLGINILLLKWYLFLLVAIVFVGVGRNWTNTKKVLWAYTNDDNTTRLSWIEKGKVTIEAESYINEEHSRKRGLFNGYYSMARSLIMMMALLQCYAWLQPNKNTSFMMLITEINNNPAYLFLWAIIVLLLMSRYWHFSCARFSYTYNGFIYNRENPANYKIVEKTREIQFEHGVQKKDTEVIKWMKK